MLNKITVEINGKSYSGSYTVDSRMITVLANTGGTKTTQLGNSTADSLGRMLLREIIRDSEPE